MRRSIKAMGFLLCNLVFLWLTSTDADQVVPQDCVCACTHTCTLSIAKYIQARGTALGS